jgi:hypothetical protein
MHALIRHFPVRLTRVSGGNAKWRVLYRGDVDQDRTSRSSETGDAALEQAMRFCVLERAEIYRIEGPDGLILPKEQAMRSVSASRR